MNDWLRSSSLFLLFSVLLLFSTPSLSQSAPLCDIVCSPDPGSPGYGNTAAVRPKILNARGNSSPLAAQATPSPTVTGTPASLTEILAGSQSYNFTIPILRLAGRAGMDLNLN